MLGLNIYRFSDTPTDDVLSQIKLAASLGAQLVRVPISWATLEPVPGHYVWSDTDRVIAALDAAGYHPTSAPVVAPSMGATGRSTYQDPPLELDALSTICAEIAARYAGRGLRLESFDEVEFSAAWTPTVAAAVWTAAYAGVKAGDPNCAALNGGIGKSSVLKGTDTGRWLLTLLSTSDLSLMTDSLNVHYYGNTEADMVRMRVRLRGAVADVGPAELPLTLTEIGRGAHSTTAPYKYESGEALYITEVVGTETMSGWADVVVFKVQDRRLDRGTFAYHGLVASDGHMKPAASAYRTLARPRVYTDRTVPIHHLGFVLDPSGQFYLQVPDERRGGVQWITDTGGYHPAGSDFDAHIDLAEDDPRIPAEVHERLDPILAEYLA